MKRIIIAVVLAVVLIAGGLGGFVYATNGSHEPMTGQKLVGTGLNGSAVGVYWETGFTFTNPDGVSEITIEQISIIRSDGTVIYEGTPWLEPIKPHGVRTIELDEYIEEPETLPPDIYTVEIFWGKSHKKGLPLIGSSMTVVLELDGVEVTGITGWFATEMVNMEQTLEPEH